MTSPVGYPNLGEGHAFLSVVVKKVEAGALLGRAIIPKCLLSGSFEDRVHRVAIDTMRSICSDSNRRLAGYSKEISLLDRGVFYPHDYYRALASIGEAGAKRLGFLFEKGSFYHGIAPSKHFSIPDTTPDHKDRGYHITGKVALGYQIKEGILPSDTLKAMMSGLFFLDCGQVCYLSYCYAIFEVLGEKRFDALFVNFNFQMENSKHTLAKLVKAPESTGEVFGRAQMVYINNVKIYSAKHPFGACQGYNLLALDSGIAEEISFLGFGLNEAGVSYAELKAILLSELNAVTLADDLLPEKYKTVSIRAAGQRARRLDDTKLTEKEFAYSGAGKLVTTLELDFERLSQLAKASTDEEAVSLLKLMNPRFD